MINRFPKLKASDVLIGCLFLFVFLFPMLSNAKILVLAQISERPKKDFKELRPMVSYMATKLKSLGYTQGKVRLFSDTQTLIEAVNRGEVHWITETAKTAAELINKTGAKLLVNKWKNGQQSYASILYTRHDNAIMSIDDLNGKVIAFESEDSFSSYYLPRALIEERGMTLRKMESLREKPRADEVGYVFSRNEKNNVLWTTKQLVDVGVVNNGDWGNINRVPAALKTQLRILFTSSQFPRAYEIVTPAMSEPAVALLKKTLLEMNLENSDGVLARYEKATGFGPLPTGYRQQLNGIYKRSLAWGVQ